MQEIEDFYGVYLLVSKSPNPKFAGQTYIGYTVDPNRRIKQHNLGKDAGGARKTSNRGPWTMVMIIHGFPNNISALRFEWAWQQPRLSRRLKHIPELQKKLRKESNFEYNFRILSEMLRIGPWNRLPLIVRWLADEYHREFEVGKMPPLHMPICFGRIKKVNRKKKKEDRAKNQTGSQTSKQTVSNHPKNSKIAINYDVDEYDLLVMGGMKSDDVSREKVPGIVDASIVISSDSDNDSDETIPTVIQTCVLCGQAFNLAASEKQFDLILSCLHPSCSLLSHLECLAELFLEPGQYVPIEGSCPICETHLLWGDVIRKANGCSDLVDDTQNVDPLDVDNVSDEAE